MFVSWGELAVLRILVVEDDKQLAERSIYSSRTTHVTELSPPPRMPTEPLQQPKRVIPTSSCSTFISLAARPDSLSPCGS